MTAPSDRIDTLLDTAGQALDAAGIEGGLQDAKWLLAHLLDVNPSWFLLHGDQHVPLSQQQQFRDMIDARKTGKPVSRIIGSRGFWTLDLALNAHTLDPRADSECLIDSLLQHRKDKTAALRVLDLGTGTGCLLLAALSEYPNAYGVGIDLAPQAAHQAADNARRNGLESRASFLAGHWAGAIDGSFDIILCNPPYIAHDETSLMNREALDFDPALALFADHNGLAAYQALFPEMPRLLANDGLALFECGFRQTDSLIDLANQYGFTVQDTLYDLGQNPRGIAFTKK